MAKKTKNSIFTSKFLLFLLFIIAIILFCFKYYSPNKLEKLYTSCEDFDTIFKTTKNNLTNDFKTTIREYPVYDGNHFLWRRSLSEPKVGYPVQKSKMIYVYSQPAEIVFKQFSEATTKSLETLGFVKQSLNYIPFSKSAISENGGGKYSYTKGGYVYQVDINGNYLTDVVLNADGSLKEEIKLPENSTGVSITCGDVDPEYDKIYDKIIPQNEYKKNQEVEVIEFKDMVVSLNVREENTGGGFASYWLVSDLKVEQLIKGTQEYPQCSIFESRSVGTGITCFDSKTEITREVQH